MAIVALDKHSVRTSPNDWQALVKSAVRDPKTLRERLELPPEQGECVAHHEFATFVPLPYLDRIAKGDLNDPLLLQVLPDRSELDQVPGFSTDAVGDTQASRTNGLIQKYKGRALLMTSRACAIHCRYCFRRHFPYQTAPVSLQQFDQVLDVVRQDESLEELILSGGDPLMMVDDKFQQLVEWITEIGHLRRFRIHSRLPVVIPQRVTTQLMRVLQRVPQSKWFVLHVNHANEIDTHVEHAIAKLQQAGCNVLNQAVLLKNVNDNVDALVNLSKRLVDLGCMPYYLHQLDRVTGTAHFEVDPATGVKLVESMREYLPGYAIPEYVCEVAGAPSKLPVDIGQ